MKRPWWLFVAACFCLAPTSRAQVNILEEGFGPARNGANLNETTLTTSNVNTGGFGLIMSLPVSGEIYAQPLIVSGITINGTKRNALYVATMNDVVYCFDADTGASLWSVTLGTPVPTPTGNINGTIGIESTPNINASTQTMYLVTDTLEQGNPTFRIHVLNIATGADEIPSVIIAGSVQGTGAANVNGTITFNASIENQRPGLAFANGMIFVSFASYGDSGPYHGFLFTYDAQTLAQAGIFCDTLNGASAGIWMSGRAPAVDSSGNVYLITGNGDVDDSANFGESFLKFSTGTDAFSLSSYFTPSNWAALNANDADLGSSGAMLIANYVVGGGKTSVIYVLNQADLGEQVQGDTQVPQYFSNTVGGYILSNPAFNPLSGLYYVWTGGGRVMNAYQFNASTLFNTSPVASSSVTSQAGSQGAALSVSANGSTPGTAIVWANLPSKSYGAASDGVPGVVYAFDAGTLTELWDSNQNAARDSIGNWSKFRPPVVANGKVYVGSASGYLAVYGVLPASQLSSSATYTGTDTTTEGTWGSAYGGDGYLTPVTTNTPSYAVVSVKNTSVYTWASSTSDPRAINGQANCWYSTTPAMSFDINLTDGNTHQIAFYLLDWDSKGRSESITVADAATGTVLNSVAASNFANGVYYRWNASGHVVVTVTMGGGPNAVVSGVFFGAASAPSGTATFVKTDTTTQGNWQASYGADGYSIAASAQNLPSYAVLTPQNAGTWTWATNSSDPRALQTNSGGVATAWYNQPSFSFDLKLTDGNSHQVALYALDWDSRGRAETITITDGTTGAVLNTQQVSSFSGGVYLVWSISGHAVITVTSSAGPNAVISGVFFGLGNSSAGGTSGTSGSGSLTGAIVVQLPSGVTAALPGNLTIAPNQSQQITVTITNETSTSVAVTTTQQ